MNPALGVTIHKIALHKDDNPMNWIDYYKKVYAEKGLDVIKYKWDAPHQVLEITTLPSLYVKKYLKKKPCKRSI